MDEINTSIDKQETVSLKNSGGNSFKIIATIVVVIVLGLLVWFFASNKVSNKPVQALYPGKITIGLTEWPGYLPIYIADEQGYFKQAGLDVQIKKYDSLIDLANDYKDDKVQVETNLTLQAVNELLSGVDQKIIVAIDYSNGADAIMAGQAIKDVPGFKGKKVAYEKGTLEEFFLEWALNTANLTKNDIVTVDASPEKAASLLASDSVDVAVTYEPFISSTLGSNKFHKVYTSHDAPGLITDILTVKSNFITQYPEASQALVKAYFQGYDFWKTHPDQADAILAKAYNTTGQNIAQQLKGVTILDLRGNKTAFTFAPGLQSLYGNLKKIAEFVAGQKSIDANTINTDSLVEPRFVRTLSE